MSGKVWTAPWLLKAKCRLGFAPPEEVGGLACSGQWSHGTHSKVLGGQRRKIPADQLVVLSTEWQTTVCLIVLSLATKD